MNGIEYDRLEPFQAAAAKAFVPVRVRVPREADFRAAIGGGTVNGVAVGRIAGTPCSVHRDARLIGSADPEMLKVALIRRGRAGVEQDDQQCVVRPGDLVAYDTTRPYELRYWDDFDITVLAIPRARLGPSAELIRRRSASPLPVDVTVRSVVSGCLAGLGADLDGLSPAAGMHLADALVSLVTSAFTDEAPERAEPDSALGDRVVAHCLANLSDPDLSVGSVARRHGISVRHLHRVLSGRGISLAAWIRHERLLRIRRDLSNPALAHRTAAEIAARWGILDPTHLSRALKAEFGRTAKEIRSAGPEAEPAQRRSRPAVEDPA
ncbi:helix-turn-helix domain-containing protein [Actinomadura vinacea]|uniref:Helix-turn-helix domain-containing protein n=1 Tax=Actinomadura vinacea TaxID=115336 RepID=A0ABP5VCA5_9ACTN